MKNQPINPDSLYVSIPMGYSHAISANGKATIYCSGQIAWDKDNNLVGSGDIGIQSRQVLANLKTVLQDAGAEVSDIVRLRTYVVNHNPSLLETIAQAMVEFYGDNVPAANTLIGVQALALPEFLIEIEATAVVR